MQTFSANATGAVGYYRVSTVRQGRSGLGLEAQQKAVHDHILSANWHLYGEFTEVESGKRADRPQLAAALELCRQRRATLVIAKLDRLARNVAFVATLLNSKVRFVAADMPEADIAFLQMAAVFGEWEARKVSERTKAALEAAKARGQKLGWANPARVADHHQASVIGAQANRAKAEVFAENVRPIIESIQRNGHLTLAETAAALNLRGVKTARDGIWHASSVSRILSRATA